MTTPPRVQDVMTRQTPADAPERLLTAHDDTPRQLTFPTGETGLLVTGYDDVRRVLSDAEAFSSVDAPFGHLINDDPGAPVPPGAMLGMNGADHMRLRGKLVAEFTVRRMRSFAPHVRSIVDDVLDGLTGHTADLNREFSQRVTAHTIGELLGLPTQDREQLGHWATQINDITLPSATRRTADDHVHHYVRERLHAGTPGLLSRLVRSSAESDDPLSDDELTTIGATLVVAGQETTANAISLGALTLIRDPELRRRLATAPSSITDLSEELLRYQSIVHLGVARRCTSATTVAGREVQRGDLVVPSIADANHDPALTSCPQRLDPRRGRTRHVAFGHGAHQCLGQHLARLQLAESLTALVRRVPSLALAVPVDQVRGLMNMTVYGVDELPVRWQEILPRSSNGSDPR